MALDISPNITPALSQTFAKRLVKAWNRQALTSSMLPVVSDGGAGVADENAAKAPKSRAKRAPVEPDAPELAAPADEPAEAEPVVAEPDEPDWSGVALPGGGVSD